MKNFEKFKTVDERANGYEDFCSNHECKYCPLHDTKPDCGESRGQFAWLELDADNEKPLPCPFCGKDVEILTKGDYNTWNQVKCSCGYRGSWWSDKDKAVAAHNRVASAVIDSNNCE